MIGGHGLARTTKATLEAQLPDAVAAVNAQAGAPVALVVPTTYYVYGQLLKPELAIDGVAVEVSSPDQTLRNVDVNALAADGEGVVQVVVWAQEVDFPTLVERLHRYASAVLAVVVAPDACGAGTTVREAQVRVRIADVEPEAQRDQPILAGAGIRLIVDYVEPLDL